MINNAHYKNNQENKRRKEGRENERNNQKKNIAKVNQELSWQYKLWHPKDAETQPSAKPGEQE